MSVRVLDLFCGAGGAAMGYYRAFGPDSEIVGVDIAPQPNYPFTFVQADAMTFPLDGFDMIHASPPCQAYSITRHTHTVEYPDLVAATRELLTFSATPWVLENVIGAPMPSAITLCGASFGLHAWDEKSGRELWLKRHRLFESSHLMMPPPCACSGKMIGGVYGGGPNNRRPEWGRGGYCPPLDVQRELMGIDWMPGKSLHEAIPPAYTEWIGRQLLPSLARAAVVGALREDNE